VGTQYTISCSQWLHSHSK